MFFTLLKLVGIDVKAKIAELKADLTRTARITGLVAGLFFGAAILVLMLLIVALIALYKWGEIHHGIFVGLALDAGALIVLALVLVLAAVWIARQGGNTTTLPADFAEAPVGGATRVAQYPPGPKAHLTDDLLRVGSRAQETTNEAVARVTELMRNGDRATVLSIIGAAALMGWLIGRAAARDKVN
jgi:uncharacterized membrane protein YedE/YeeE